MLHGEHERTMTAQQSMTGFIVFAILFAISALLADLPSLDKDVDKNIESENVNVSLGQREREQRQNCYYSSRLD
jgi:hypothetical protein